MPRDYKKEAAWAKQKYGPQFKTTYESEEQRDQFIHVLQKKNIKLVEWFRQKVDEEIAAYKNESEG